MFVWQVNILISGPHNGTLLRYDLLCYQSTCPLNIALSFVFPDISSPSRDLSSHLAGAMPNPPPLQSAPCISPAKRRWHPAGCCPCLCSQMGRVCSPSIKCLVLTKPSLVSTRHAWMLHKPHFPLLSLFFKSVPLSF